MPRIFIAIPVADNVRAALGELPRREVPFLRRVRDEQLHITLKFLGEVPLEQVSRVHASVDSAVNAAASHGSASLHLSAHGLGAFPNERSVRILWAGVAPSEPLQNLQAEIEETLAAEGFPKEARRFTPHITLARARNPQPFPAALLPFKDHHFGNWDVDAVEVMESRLSPAGPCYNVLHRAPLGRT